MIERQLEEFVTNNKCNLIWMEPDDATTSRATPTAMAPHFAPMTPLFAPRRRGRRRY